MERKTALVTGCSGYLGSHLVKQLKRNDWNVVGLDTRHTFNEYIDIFHQDDVRNPGAFEEIFSRLRIDTVFHLAGRIEIGLSKEQSTEFWDTNVGGTCNLLNSMKRHKVENIVYSSSAGVYKPTNHPLKEFSATAGNNVYAKTKLAAESAIKDSGINYIIFRYFNLAGADPEGEFGEDHDPETHLIPSILKNLNTFKVYGDTYHTPDGTCVRDFIHVSDVASAHVSAANMLLNHNLPSTINLGTGKGYSILEIIKYVEQVTKQKVEYTIADKRLGDPDILVADNTFAKNILNFSPRYSIMDMIKTSNDWIKNGKQ